MTLSLAWFAFKAALLFAAVAARQLAREAPTHRPVATILAIAFVADVARAVLFALDTGLLARRALFLVFPAVSVWCTGAVLLGPSWGARRRAAWLAWCIATWALAVATFVHLNPPRGSPAVEHLALASRGATLAVELVIVLLFALRRRRPSFTQVVALLLFAGDAGELAGPWLWPSVWQAWELARGQWALVYGTVAAVQHARTRWIRRLHAAP